MEAARVMVREAKEFGFLEEYYPEIESSFTTLFYVNTLFTYMAGIERKEYEFCESVREGNEGDFSGIYGK